jgi:hypothetical protein
MLAVMQVEDSPMVHLQAAAYSASLFDALWEEGGGRPLVADGAVNDGGCHFLLVHGTSQAVDPRMDLELALVVDRV